jgi:hypothetical protein
MCWLLCEYQNNQFELTKTFVQSEKENHIKFFKIIVVR